ncbi:MAG: hypothetical protein JWN33_94 [Candidatus Saccharibacteria bacterium]|nr:hypothetical protein [Candidatus Saccharibacteria bacterium]
MLTQRKHRPGFTIVELLIVIVIIGILAAIAIVAYNGIQNRARAASVSAALSQAARKIAAFQVDNSDAYPTTLSDVGVTDGSAVTYQYSVNNTSSPRTYCITATATTISYFVNSASSTPQAGACPGHGLNGVSAITNLATNPSFETNMNGLASGRAFSTRDTSWATSGTYSLRITPNGSLTDDDSFMAPGGDTGGMRLGMEAGKTYTVSASARLPLDQVVNQITNPSFETDWTTGPTVSYITTDKHSGNRSVEINNVTGATAVVYPQTIPVTAGQVWRVQGWWKTSADNNGTPASQKIRIGDQSGGLINALPTNVQVNWNQAYIDVTIPAGVTGIRIQVGSDSTVGWIRYDDISALNITGRTNLPTSASELGSIDPRARRIQAYWKTSAGAYIVAESAQLPNTTGASQRLSTTFTIPVGATEAFIRLYDGAIQGGGDILWDALMLTEGASQPNYADGSSANWVWNGTDHNSTSTGPPL